MEKNKEKAFDFASETTKQLITLATAIITLTVTFSKDVIGSINQELRIYLAVTWGIFILSIILGILTMMSLTGTLDPMKNDENEKDNQEKPMDMSINGQNVKNFSKYQILTFLIGLILTVVFGYKSLNTNITIEAKGYKVIRQTKFGSDSTVYKDTIIIPIR